ncbi:hypothetical protein [Pontibacter ramchanderi]|uniref:Lipocalin-like protein n=1 Tax=Pontibacter ramchanderi TaxID=1179743 RepID=A0A2N3V2L9_9BACT|nr:hypothetical protein [Pontibacter ramchanderi]PKV75860.1 hypothetical protein BD749_0807 [Pontibacter ramchanderi]
MTSCDKDDDKEPSQRDLLTSSAWKGEAIMANGRDISDIYYEEIGYDIKKNTVKYDKAGTYVDSYERMSLSGTWEFANNDKSIIFDKGTEDEYTAKVLKLTNSELQLENAFEIDGDTYYIEVWYNR